MLSGQEKRDKECKSNGGQRTESKIQLMKNPHAVALGRKGGLARKGKPGRKLSSEEAKRIRAMRKKSVTSYTEKSITSI